MIERTCDWCHGPIPPRARIDARTCSRKCRQAAFRLRRRMGAAGATDPRSQTDTSPGTGAGRQITPWRGPGVVERPMHVAYADPPYPGRARLYADQDSYGGEVDHEALIARLEDEYPDGWALSTAADCLRWILPLCPPEAHVCPWVKPIGVPPATYGLHYTWEPLIVVRGRQVQPGMRDWLLAQPARHGGDLIGRKPIAFAAHLFDALGLRPGDTLDDLYPGTGIIARAWAEASRTPEPATRPTAGAPSAGQLHLGKEEHDGQHERTVAAA